MAMEWQSRHLNSLSRLLLYLTIASGLWLGPPLAPLPLARCGGRQTMIT